MSETTRLETRAVAGGGTGVLRGVFAALAHRNFRLFYWGHLLSLTGTWMQTTALGWLVLELTDSELLLGIVTASMFVPILFVSPLAGVIADRVDKRRILLAAQSVSFVQALLLAVLTHTGAVGVGWIIALMLVLGTANAFDIPTRQSFFVELVGQRDLTNAIALNSSAFNATRMIGPAVAGLLIGTAGIAVAFYLNALSYLAVIVALLAIRRAPPRAEAGGGSAWQHLREGVAWIVHHPVARLLVAAVAVISVFLLPVSMLLPVFARDVLRVGPEGLGALFSATGAGALVGGLSLAGFAERVRRGPMLLGAGAAFAALVGAFALSTSFPLSLALLALAGFCMILTTASVNALLQALVPNAMRGRVMAVYVVMFLGISPLGHLQAGALARWLGAPTALALGAAVSLVALLGFAWRSPRLRGTR